MIAIAACGGDSVSVDDFEAELLNAFCASSVACGSTPDVATCKASVQFRDKEMATLIAKAKAGAISYSSDKAGECIADIESRTCTFDGFYSTGVSPCTQVFTGKVAADGACLLDEECADANCEATDPDCDNDTMCCPGTCKAIPAKVAVGGDCSNAPCVDDAYCSSTTNKCTAPITTAGTACDDIDACANPMYCNIFSQTPTCVAPGARNATCDPSLFVACADNRDYCDETTMTCTPAVAVGQACGGANGAVCVGYAQCTNMSCVARPVAGASCTVNPQTMNDNCLADLTCAADGASCTLPAAATACTRVEPTTSTGFEAPEPALIEARRALRALDDKRVKAGLGWIPTLRD